MPGLIAERVDPKVVAERARNLDPIVLVAGTNGKTTTTSFVARLLRARFGPPVINASGANLHQAVATTLILKRGDPRRRRPAVFEVDELVLPRLATEVRPSVIVLTNLFRDQLDRYGEVDVVVRRWRGMAATLASTTTLVYCADDPRLEMLARSVSGRTMTFGLDWSEHVNLRESTTAADPVACIVCGAPLRFSARSIAHLGRFACPDGHVVAKTPDIAGRLDDSGETPCIVLRSSLGTASFPTPVASTGGVYDAAAAAAVGVALGMSLAEIAAALDLAPGAFGRHETIEVHGRRVHLTLGKNPASLADLAVFASRDPAATVLLALNDAAPDGRDVSWIWDADLAPLFAAPTVVLSGSRASDLALRLKYGPTPTATGRTIILEPDLGLALDRAIGAAEVGDRVLVVATYTALLRLRARLERRGVAARPPT